MNLIQQQRARAILSKFPKEQQKQILLRAAIKRLARGEKVNDALKAFDDLLKTKRGMPKSGIASDPKVVVAKIGALLIGKGTVKFAQWARSIIQASRAYGISDNDIEPFLKLTYGSIMSSPQSFGLTDQHAETMDTPSDVRKADIEKLLNEDNV